MRSLFTTLTFAILCCVGSNIAYATPEKPLPPLRIQQLLQGLFPVAPLALDPALPDEFIGIQIPVLGKKGSHKYYWGTTQNAKTYFCEKKLVAPLFRAWITTNVTLNPDGKTFSNERTFGEDFVKYGIKDGVAKKLFWGSHPVLTFVGTMSEGKFYIAWIGSPFNNNVLLVQLLSPFDSQETENIWNRFINETKELQGMDRYRAIGQEMHEGCTFFTAGEIKLKATAELNKHTNQLIYIVESLTPQTTFEIDHADLSFLGGEWKSGHLLLKIYGTAVQQRDEQNNVGREVISVLVNEVDILSMDLPSLDKKKGIAFRIEMKSPSEIKGIRELAKQFVEKKEEKKDKKQR